MSLPTQLPINAVTLLIDYLTPGGRTYTVRELVEAGYELEGYVLSQLFPVDPQPKMAIMSDNFDLTDVEVLQLMLAKQGPFDNFPWLLVLDILDRVLDWYRPKAV